MFEAWGINDIGQVIGSLGPLDDYDGCLWTSSMNPSVCPLVKLGEAQPISELIPAEFTSEITNIDPVTLSGTDADGNVRIDFLADYQTGPNANGGVSTGTTGNSSSLSRPAAPCCRA